MQQQHTLFSFFTRLLSVVGITLLFLVIVVASPSRAFAAGECFDTTSIANSGGITITEIEGIEDTMHPNDDILRIKVHAILKDPGAMDFWTSNDRDYKLVSAQIEASGLISPDGVESTASNISQEGTSGIVITFNPSATGFTQLDSDQQTSYALSLQAHKYVGSTSCRLTSYVVNRSDDAPPPIRCGDPNTIGQCEANGGCGKNETCAQLMANFVCQKVVGSCKYLSCGALGSTSGGNACGCTGASFDLMPGTTGDRCCGWVVNGACQATAPPAAPAECGVPTVSGPNAVVCQFSATDFSFISGGSSTDPKAYQCTTEPTKCCRSVTSCPAVTNTCGRTQLVNGETRCVVGANNFPLGETSGLTVCTADNKFCCSGTTACTNAIAADAAANPPANPDPAADPAADSGGETSPSDEGSLLDAIKGPTNKTFDALNPLNISAGLKDESSKSPYLRSFATPGGVVSRLLLFAFPIAGIILFLMIVWGGFEMVTGAANAKSMDAGKQRITAAVIGFILLFVSYWLMQLIELIFGLSIL